MRATLIGLAFSLAAYAENGARTLFTYREPARLCAYADASSARALFHAFSRAGGEPGTSVVQTTPIDQRAALVPGDQTVAFEVPGFEISAPVVVMAPLASGRRALAYFTMIDSATAHECRKESAELAECAAYAAKRAIGLAEQGQDSKWLVKGPVIEAKDTPDHASPEVSSAFTKGAQVWLYFLTPGGIFRQRIGGEGAKLLGPADRVTFDGSPGAAMFDYVNVVRLKCDVPMAPSIVTMVASTRARNAIPFLASTDGITFRQEKDTLVKFMGNPLAAPVQLPLPATTADCRNYFAPHETNRTLVYSERKLPGTWEVKETAVTILVSGMAPSADDGEPAAAPVSNHCTAAAYLAAHPSLTGTYRENPMMHYLVFGKDEGACEPSQ